MNSMRRWRVAGLVGLGVLAVVGPRAVDTVRPMTFVQSKVTPNLYLVRHPASDRQALYQSVRHKAMERMSVEFVGNEQAYRSSPYSLLFYEYTDNGVLSLFGGAGTAYFLENHDDPGSFGSEQLRLYVEQHIADFDIRFCDGTTGYQGVMTYSWQGVWAGIDVIVDTCPPSTSSEPADAEVATERGAML